MFCHIFDICYLAFSRLFLTVVFPGGLCFCIADFVLLLCLEFMTSKFSDYNLPLSWDVDTYLSETQHFVDYELPCFGRPWKLLFPGLSLGLTTFFQTVRCQTNPKQCGHETFGYVVHYNWSS